MNTHTASTFIFLLHDNTHFLFLCFMTAHTSLFQHPIYVYNTHIYNSFTLSNSHVSVCRFGLSHHTLFIFFCFCYVHIYIYIYIYIFTYNKTCLWLLHLNIYLYIHIMLFFYLRKFTRFCLDEISVALISFHCYCQPNSGVSSNHIKRRISEDMITWWKGEGFLYSTG
jgi:hypothetical protein